MSRSPFPSPAAAARNRLDRAADAQDIGGIAALDAQVRGREFAIGDRFEQTDIGIGCNLAMLTFLAAGLDLQVAELKWRENHPELAAYVDRLEARPSFQKTRPRSTAVDLAAVMTPGVATAPAAGREGAA